jgi:hypothetical protein
MRIIRWAAGAAASLAMLAGIVVSAPRPAMAQVVTDATAGVHCRADLHYYVRGTQLYATASETCTRP